MIRVLKEELQGVRAEALIRSVSSELDPLTAVSRDLEQAAGEDVSRRLRSMGALPVGAAVITPGGELGASFLIHVVLQSSEQPVGKEGVRLALQNGLRRAQEWGLETVATPILGAGAGNLSVEDSAQAMVPLILDHQQHFEFPGEVFLVVDSEYELDVFNRTVEVAGRKASAWGN